MKTEDRAAGAGVDPASRIISREEAIAALDLDEARARRFERAELAFGWGGAGLFAALLAVAVLTRWFDLFAIIAVLGVLTIVMDVYRMRHAADALAAGIFQFRDVLPVGVYRACLWVDMFAWLAVVAVWSVTLAQGWGMMVSVVAMLAPLGVGALVRKALIARFSARARDADGALCLWCSAGLQDPSPEGTCPACGGRYHSELNRRIWFAIRSGGMSP